MFEEDSCIVCGKLLPDGRVYCSKDCEKLETSSECSSSAFSSPSATPFDMPSDVTPFSLEHALGDYRKRANRYSVSSESTSSYTSWSMHSEDELDEELGVQVYDGDPDSSAVHEQDSSKSPSTVHPSALSFARRASGTNNRAMGAMLLHQRNPSSSSSKASQGTPSIHSSSADEEDEPTSNHAESLTSKARRQRNRASLPAYFSLLQGGSSGSPHISPISTSSSYTIARPSPPTPKITLASLATALPLVGKPTRRVDSISTPVADDRGRRRSRHDGQRSERSRSPSRSRSNRPACHAIEVTSSILDSFSPRGRVVRRNSSPTSHKGVIAFGGSPLATRESRERGREPFSGRSRAIEGDLGRGR